MQIAAEIFPIRFVCGFGGEPPDGVVPLDDLFTRREARSAAAARARARAAAGPGRASRGHHLGRGGRRPRAGRAQPCRADRRRARGRCSKAGSRRTPSSSSTLAMSSFAGLAIALVPWLLVGGTLVLHHPFDADDLRRAAQRPCAATPSIVPGPLVAPVRRGRASVGARRPQAACSASGARPSGCRARRPGAMPTIAHGRRAGVRRDRPDRRAARRRAAGRRRFRSGRSPRRAAPRARVIVGEVAAHRRRHASRCAARWCRAAPSRPAPSAPRCPHFKVAPNGFVDTGYACRIDRRHRHGGDRTAGRHRQRRRLSLRRCATCRTSSAQVDDGGDAGGAARRARRPPAGRHAPPTATRVRRRWPSSASTRCWSAPSATARPQARLPASRRSLVDEPLTAIA